MRSSDEFIIDLTISEGLLLASIFFYISNKSISFTSPFFSHFNRQQRAHSPISRVNLSSHVQFPPQIIYRAISQSWLNLQFSRARKRARLSRAQPRGSSNQTKSLSKSPIPVFVVQMSITGMKIWDLGMKEQVLSR